MIRVCAWCNGYIGEKEPFDDPAVTHGMCDDCAEQMKLSIFVLTPDDPKVYTQETGQGTQQ